MTRPDCPLPESCDCAHPGECLFAPAPVKRFGALATVSIWLGLAALGWAVIAGIMVLVLALFHLV